MREQGIQEAVAHDKHFEQMGFKALLRDERDD
jgi:predicted nucleic acid-binding protein